jgi:hypothetical protein
LKSQRYGAEQKAKSIKDQIRHSNWSQKVRLGPHWQALDEFFLGIGASEEDVE